MAQQRTDSDEIYLSPKDMTKRFDPNFHIISAIGPCSLCKRTNSVMYTVLRCNCQTFCCPIHRCLNFQSG